MDVWTIVGCVAGVIAAGGTWLTYRAGVPRVSVYAGVLPHGPQKGSLSIVVANGRNADATIDFEGIVFKRTQGFAPADEALGSKPVDRFMPLELSGPDLPHRLLGHDRVTWHADLTRVNWDLEHDLGPDDRGKVVLTVGEKRRQVRIQHYVTKIVTRATY